MLGVVRGNGSFLRGLTADKFSSKWDRDRQSGAIAHTFLIVKSNRLLERRDKQSAPNVNTPSLFLTCVCVGLSRAARRTPALADRCFTWASDTLLRSVSFKPLLLLLLAFKIAINLLLGM